MRYQLVVTRIEENPTYVTDVQAYTRNQMSQYGMPDSAPSPELRTVVLEVELEPEEFQAVKKAVVEAM